MTIDGRTPFRVMEDTAMPAIVDFPTVVKEALNEFQILFRRRREGMPC